MPCMRDCMDRSMTVVALQKNRQDSPRDCATVHGRHNAGKRKRLFSFVNGERVLLFASGTDCDKYLTILKTWCNKV